MKALMKSFFLLFALCLSASVAMAQDTDEADDLDLTPKSLNFSRQVAPQAELEASKGLQLPYQIDYKNVVVDLLQPFDLNKNVSFAKDQELPTPNETPDMPY